MSKTINTIVKCDNLHMLSQECQRQSTEVTDGNRLFVTIAALRRVLLANEDMYEPPSNFNNCDACAKDADGKIRKFWV